MKKVNFLRHRCKGCGMCVMFCPQKVLRMADDLNQQGLPYPEMIEEERCTTCGICFRMCPDTAIEVNKPVLIKREESEK